MRFDPKKVPGVGELILIDIEYNETVRGEFDKLFELIKITEDKTKPLRTTRDKFIGHKDLDVVDGEVNIHKPGYTIHNIADILESVNNILRCLYIHFSGKDN